MSAVNLQRINAAAVYWHSSLYPLFLFDEFNRAKEANSAGEHGDGSGGVCVGNNEIQRSGKKKREAVMRRVGRKVEK